jgi:multiple antibiotic resistance protein
MTEHKRYQEVIVAGSVVLIAGGVFTAVGASHELGENATQALTLTSQFFAFEPNDFWTFFAALFAIMNPVIALPLFVRVSQRSGVVARRRLARLTSMTVLIALVLAALLGQELLGFFAISIGAFRIAGGIIVLLMGLAMLKATSEDTSPEARKPGPDTNSGNSQAICPIAIPLLAGPGGIATIILQSQAARVPGDHGMIALAIILIVALTYLTLRLAQPIAKLLGPIGLMVTTRLIGMVVAAIAIDMMVIGLCLSIPAIA